MVEKSKKDKEEDKERGEKGDGGEDEEREEKEDEKDEGKEKEIKRKKALRKRQNRQIMWLVVLMTCLILIIVLVPYVKKNYFNKFDYIGLEFQKTQLGNIIFYSTRIPIVNSQGQMAGDYTMNFRSDPRELGNISVTVWENLISFEKEKEVYITLYPEMDICEDNAIAIVNLANFLGDFGGLSIKSASSKKDFADANNVPYVTCQNTPNNTVIYINSGEESRIRKVNENCYEIIYEDCEILPVSERFIMVILEKYMSYFAGEKNEGIKLIRGT